MVTVGDGTGGAVQQGAERSQSPGRKPVLVVDVTGKRCPVPLLRARMALEGREPGVTILVLSTDPDSIDDFKVFQEKGGCAMCSLTTTEHGGRQVYEFRLVK